MRRAQPLPRPCLVQPVAGAQLRRRTPRARHGSRSLTTMFAEPGHTWKLCGSMVFARLPGIVKRVSGSDFLYNPCVARTGNVQSLEGSCRQRPELDARPLRDLELGDERRLPLSRPGWRHLGVRREWGHFERAQRGSRDSPSTTEQHAALHATQRTAQL
jgi:hypothetical protein